MRAKGIVKYGRKIEWSKIAIGQAFYFKGCHGLGVKISDEKLIVLDTNWYPCVMISHCVNEFILKAYYKLPKSLSSCLEAL